MIQRILQARRRRDAQLARLQLEVVNAAIAPLLVEGGKKSLEACERRLKTLLSYGEPSSEESSDAQVEDTFAKLLAMARQQEANGNLNR